jgi:hypothetical protein
VWLDKQRHLLGDVGQGIVWAIGAGVCKNESGALTFYVLVGFGIENKGMRRLLAFNPTTSEIEPLDALGWKQGVTC